MRNNSSGIINSKTLKRFIITVILLVIITPISLDSIFIENADGKVVVNNEEQFQTEPKAPMVASGDNLYIVWWTNKSGNWEVMFRASNDDGATFNNKINLSNSTDTDSQNAQIVASGNNVFVSWWENSLTNGTSESVFKESTDDGRTFGPLLILGDDGTLRSR
jgi:hypothetical protein